MSKRHLLVAVGVVLILAAIMYYVPSQKTACDASIRDRFCYDAGGIAVNTDNGSVCSVPSQHTVYALVKDLVNQSCGMVRISSDLDN
jgi:hypothetical protein